MPLCLTSIHASYRHPTSVSRIPRVSTYPTSIQKVSHVCPSVLKYPSLFIYSFHAPSRSFQIYRNQHLCPYCIQQVFPTIEFHNPGKLLTKLGYNAFKVYNKFSKHITYLSRELHNRRSHTHLKKGNLEMSQAFGAV